MRAVGSLAVLLATSLVSGCSAIADPDTVDTLTRPAITHETALAVIKHYAEVYNSANRDRDEQQIATVETGSLLRQRQAKYKISRTLDKPGKNLVKPFTYVDPVMGAPTYGSYPMRFVSSASLSRSKNDRHLDVWERRTAGSPWLRTFATSPKTTVKVPDLAGLQVAAAADTANLVASPQAAATALAEYLTVGTTSPHAAAFTPTKEITDLLAKIVRAKSMMVNSPEAVRNVSETFTIANPPAAFMTGSGEALVFFTLTDEYLMETAANVETSWAHGETSAFTPATRTYQHALTTTNLHDTVLAIPPKGGGKIRVLAFEDQLVDAGGY